MPKSAVLYTSRLHGAGRSTTVPALLLATLLLAVWRTPEILSTGRFWAEEGVIYFRDAALGSWYDALLAPRTGYFSAFNKLAALAATAVPLEWAPRVTVYAALAVQLTVVWIVVRSDAFARPLDRALAAAVVLFAVPSGEVWLNTINSQFHFALGTALLLATSPGVLPTPFRLGFLLLAGTTGPVSVFLAPFFAWRAWRRPSAPALAETVLIGLCALVQAWLVVQGLMGGERAGAFQPSALVAAVGVKLVALPWLGGLAGTIGQALTAPDHARQYVAAAALVAVGALLTAVMLAHPRARLLAAMALALAVLSLAGALGADPWILVTLPAVGGRYVYAPNALLGLAVLTVATAPSVTRWLRIPAALLLASFLIHGVLAYRHDGLFSGPDWRNSVAAWRADPGKTTLAIWPPGWQITLPHDRSGPASP